MTGSSRGLGAAIARRLARDGLAVAVNGRRGDGLAGDVARSIRDDGGAAEAFGGDVTDDQQAAELVAAITGRLGPVDVLVLNATGPQPEGPVTEVSWAATSPSWTSSSAPRTARPGHPARHAGPAAWPHRAHRLRGRQPAAARPVRLCHGQERPDRPARSWAREVAPYGITVNTVAPGFIPVERHADVPAQTVNAYLATVPQGIATPADIAHAVSFLASDGAGFITGQRILVDGGRSLGP